MDGFVDRLHALRFLRACDPSYRALTFTLVVYQPLDASAFSWTYCSAPFSEPAVVNNHSLLGSRSRHCYAIIRWFLPGFTLSRSQSPRANQGELPRTIALSFQHSQEPLLNSDGIILCGHLEGTVRIHRLDGPSIDDLKILEFRRILQDLEFRMIDSEFCIKLVERF